jgi:tetratricopeptide (TPR) repeat protein
MNWRSDNHDLLAGESLKRALSWEKKRGADLNAREKDYIHQSEAYAVRQRTKAYIKAAGFFILIVFTLVSFVQILRQFQKSKGTSGVYLALANSQLEKGTYNEAIQNYDEAIRLNPKSAEAFLFRGRAHEYLSNYTQAMEDYSQAVELQSANPEAFNGLGRIALKQGDLSKAIANFGHSLQFDPNNAEAYLGLGDSYAGINQPDSAIGAYRNAISIKPGAPEAFQRLGTALARQGKYAEAIESYTDAIRLNPELATVYLNRGEAQEASGKISLALSDYELAAKNDRNLTEAYLKKADLLVALLPTLKNSKELEQALANYAEAIRSNPQSAEAYFKRGQLLQSQGSDQLAISDFSQAITLNPSYAQAYLFRGIAYRAVGKPDDALGDLNKAIATKSDYFEAYYERGALYQFKKDKASAIEDFKKAQQSSDAPIHDKAKRALKALGVWESTPAYRTTVELHYESTEDQDLISTIQSSLTSKGYAVHVIRPNGRQSGAGIRYFNIEDKQNANDIQSLVESAIQNKSSSLRIRAGFFKKYKTEVGTIEVWVPAVSTPSSPKEHHAGNQLRLLTVQESRVAHDPALVCLGFGFAASCLGRWPIAVSTLAP